MNSILNRKFRYTYSNASLVLIVINCVVYFLSYFVFPRLMSILALNPLSIIYGHSYWQFITYMFVHGGIWHLFSNMLGLFIFGPPVERSIGTREFVLFYFLTGTLSGIASFFSYYLTGTFAVLIGASGALYAVMLLFSVLYPRAVIFIFGILPVRAPVLVIIYFFLELFSQMGSYGGSIAHMTHLFGLLFAFLYCIIRMRIKPWREWGL
ncbi:MAG: rhomboid family intramembrane serine protease [Spirochaetes bacterium]|uniref:Rhomboid family intramembrane serine protease n=1 Tax=Candidatus Ornithospirochaeta stercoripullorum TaxID=2840899 RepID=A0A9D9H2G6_9SPIO|nr:rhomboid family intramembrane serine protease [Candidatus Ornithospirochaeta stercoripullorum]